MTIALKCRPSELDTQAAIVYLSATQLLNLKVKNGDLVDLRGGDQTVSAIAWITSRADIKDTVIGMSKFLQQKLAVNLGSEILVSKSTTTIIPSATVPLQSTDNTIPQPKYSFWEELAKLASQDQSIRYLIPGQRFTLQAGKQRKEVEVLSDDAHQVFMVGDDTVFTFQIPEAAKKITFNDIAGARQQVMQAFKAIARLTNLRNGPQFDDSHHSRGILIYGAQGTGKTMLRQAIEHAIRWAAVIEWKLGVNVVKSSEPQLVYLDTPRKLPDSVCDGIKRLFRDTDGSPTLVVCEVNNPNDIDSSLRSAARFGIEVEMPVPDASQRLQILNYLAPQDFSEDLKREAAARTHGYVGADLVKLRDAIFDSYDDRHVFTGLEDLTLDFSGPHVNGLEPAYASWPPIDMQDLENALTQIKPSALQEIFLEKPDVKWADIGGQKDFKERLQEAVEWPLHRLQEMKPLGLPPTKGILLYGPPGCSKTMLVKALAAESDLNFLAVKGAELLSMYVGESERATREVFRKARSASPCIIFFDEIDAIAQRSSGNNQLNVLTTLLNEMDGFEELRNVLVIAATNKPQTIDPALLRPGRFDNVLYVGPPDADTRREILRKRCQTTSVDAEIKENLEHFVQATEGFSGAEIIGSCQEAGRFAFRKQQSAISMNDLDTSIKSMPRSITAEMLHEFEQWNLSRAQG